MLCRSGILVKTAPSSDQKASPFPYPWTPGAIDRSLMHKNAVSAVVPRDPGFLDVFIQGRRSLMPATSARLSKSTSTIISTTKRTAANCSTSSVRTTKMDSRHGLALWTCDQQIDSTAMTNYSAIQSPADAVVPRRLFLRRSRIPSGSIVPSSPIETPGQNAGRNNRPDH